MGFSKVQDAIDAIGHLGMAVVVDDEDRENEGDLVTQNFPEPELAAWIGRFRDGPILLQSTHEEEAQSGGRCIHCAGVQLYWFSVNLRRRGNAEGV